MEVSTTELFVEILVAGVLFTVALAPIFPLLEGNAWRRRADSDPEPAAQEAELFPGIQKWRDLQPWLIVAVALIYSLGVGGNRVVEEIYKNIPIVSFSDPDHQYPNVEATVKAKGESFRAWVERHKSYRKILRAGSASSLFFLLSVSFYLIVERKFRMHRHMPRRNWSRHSVVACILLVFFTVAYRMEDQHFKTDLVQVYAKMPGELGRP